MDACTDSLDLNNHNLFKIVRESFDNVKIKTQNIIEYKNDILFVWNSLNENVLTLNVKASKERNETHNTYQTLLPTDPPGYSVELLLCNETGTQLAVVGPRGASVLDLPRRWGKMSGFQGGKDKVSCRCRTLDERYFVCNPRLEARRARWHPGSSTDTHLVILSSDNSLRLYDTSGPSLIQVWGLGPTPHGGLSSAPRLPFLVGLGDTAIDFDFTPPTLMSGLAGERTDSSTALEEAVAIQWPILVLHGNGDVYKLTASLHGDSSQYRVYGPLSMFPPADDNYGVDACSLLVLQCEPPLVVIAASTGTLYHCLLLSSHDEDDGDDAKSSWSRCGSTYSLHTPDVSLFVLESIELELGLELDEEGDSVACPLHLHRHSGTNARYLCSHDAGIHALALPMVTQLERFVNAEESSIHLQLPTSVAEYLVCTHSSASEAVPVLGLVVLSAPAVLVCLLGSGEVLSLPLASLLLTSQGNQHSTSLVASDTSPLKMMLLKEPFDTRIQMLLRHNLTQPILKLGLGPNSSARDCLELVTRTTQLLREEYLQRHDRVREEIERRVRTLMSLREHQLQELTALEGERATLQNTAEQLAEKYEDAKEQQEELAKRAERVLRLAVQRQPVVSSVEKALTREMTSVRDHLQEFSKGLEQVRTKQNYHKEQFYQWQAQQKQRDTYLSQARSSTLRTSLTQMTEEIAELVTVINSLKQELVL